MSIGGFHLDGERRIQDLTKDAGKIASAITAYDEASIERRAKVLDKVNSIITATARNFILQNYNASGVQSNTGKLQGAIGATVAIMQLRDHGKPKIIVRLPKKISDYGKGDGGGNFYQAAASVNYGRVYGAKNSNKRERKKIKKKIEKKMKKTGEATIEGGVFVAKGRASKSRGQKVKFFGSSVGMTQPKNFWTLSSSQKAMIMNQAVEFFISGMMGELKI